ncbi:MAG: abortive infection family protein [Gammaproteobacteria bacterium]
MAQLPVTDAIVTALARLVDDAQTERREPNHSDIEALIQRVGLTDGDPSRIGKPVGKAKRVRGVLFWALDNNDAGGSAFASGLVSVVRGYGGYRSGSENYCGEEAISNLKAAFATEGWDLGSDGSLQPRLLESLEGKALTKALRSYADRARRGVLDSPLLAGTAKDFLEASAGHVLAQVWGSYTPGAHFPTLLGQAFSALGFSTSADSIQTGEGAQTKVQRAAYDLACALNTLRNKEGTGHGRPWVAGITSSQARFAVEAMGNIAILMLDALEARK